MDQTTRLCNILAYAPRGAIIAGVSAPSPQPGDFPAPNAIVLLANYKACTPGWSWGLNWVGSRMLLWCLSGTGRVAVNGTERSFVGGDFLFIPWGHSIHYRAAREEPFFLGGIHVIPDHDPGIEPEYRNPGMLRFYVRYEF